MKVSAVVLCNNSGQNIGDCLKSLGLIKHNDFDVEVIVVDNGSTDGSAAEVKKRFPRIILLEGSLNLGYAGGCNLGIQHALDSGSDYVWLVSPEVMVHRNALYELLNGASRYPLAGIFGSKIYFASGHELNKERYSPRDIGHVVWYAGGLMDWDKLQGNKRGVGMVDNGQFEIDADTDFVTTSSMLIRRKVLENIGLLNPKYYLYFEEQDFCQRATLAGWKLKFICQSIAWHTASHDEDLGSPLMDYYLTRNSLLFGLRYAPLYTRISLIRQSIFLYFQGKPWQKRAVLDYYTGNLGTGSFQP